MRSETGWKEIRGKEMGGIEIKWKYSRKSMLFRLIEIRREEMEIFLG